MYFHFIVGKCESKGVLTGSNAAVMSVDFDWEVIFYCSSPFECS